ncbi:MAG: hypothetical protein RIT45_3106 [Pseudomonadota bacterium]|jgi:hypothetical protein
MEMLGLSDVGEAGYIVACDAFGVGLGVVFATTAGDISRLVVVDSE